jgi:hypothetical protein
MLLECIINRVVELPEVERSIVGQHVHLDTLHLVRGKRYVVYGIIFRAGLPWYLVVDDDDAEYPRPEFAGFFNVVDDAIPSGWRFMWRCGPWPDGALLPSEWCASGYFEALLDGGPNEVALFKAKKVEIDSVSQSPQ